jgi:hypothetical protein
LKGVDRERLMGWEMAEVKGKAMSYVSVGLDGTVWGIGKEDELTYFRSGVSIEN